MKYLIGAVAVIAIAGGIFVGFSLGKNNPSDNKTNDTTKSPNSKLLDLSNQGITKVTSDIYSKTNTTDLILSNNAIKTLPSQMGKMTNVVVFKIDHNVLAGSLIGEIRKMSRLETLDVSYNKMTGIPAEIGQLTQLKTLNYSYNDITGLPRELSNLQSNLKEFNLTGNPLSQEQINKLKTSLPNTNVIF